MQSGLSNFGIDIDFLFHALAVSSDDYIFVWDLKQDTVMVSPEMAQTFGFPSTFLKNYVHVFGERIHQRDQKRVKDMVRESLQNGKEKLSLEYQILGGDGAYIWTTVRGVIKRDPETNQPEFVVGIMHDLGNDGYVDNVTGLFSYEKCRDRFTAKTEIMKDWKGTVLLVGLDDFSSINTLNNHSFGDLVLRNTIQEIQKILPDNVTMYRFDGDQIILVGDGVSREEMWEVYRWIQLYTATSHEIGGRSCRFTISAGLISFPLPGYIWPDIEKGVSIALKRAKENGKNQCVEFSEPLLEEKMYEQNLVRYLSESINNGFKGFWVAFQPVCEADNLKVKGAEILLRFQTPEGDQIVPVDFIPILETSHLIIPVGLWVLEQAIKACKAWIPFLPDFVMNVNVSYIQLRDIHFCERVENLLETYQLDTRHLIMELTESYFITDAPNINLSLNKLQDLRLQLAMDDFGTGYSSLARLAQFNVDVVKIDKLFVQSLHKSRYNHDFVESVVRLCHNVGMKVCVEGVETREEQGIVSLLNVDYIQGFYVSKPVPWDVFFRTFVQSPYDNERLIVAIDSEVRHKQLVNDRDLLLAMMEATPLCLNLWDKNVNILACNEEVINLYGAKNFQDFKDHFFEFSPVYQPDGELSEEKAKKKITDVFETGQDTFFWMHRNRIGEQIPTDVTLVRVPYQGDFIVASYTRDIRAQRALEEKSRMFQKRMKALLDAAPLCFNLWNRNLENLMCNKEAAKLFKLGSEEDYIKYFHKLSPEYQPDGSLSEEKAKEKIISAFENGREQFFWMHCTLEGEMIPAEIILVKIEGMDEGGHHMVAGYTRDMRPQLQVESAERKAAKRIKGVIDATPLSCLLWNSEEEIVDCNRIAVNMFGAEDKNDLMLNFYKFVPKYQPDGSPSLEKMKEKFEEVKKTNYCIFEWMYENREYEPIPCEVTLVTVDVEEERIIVAYSRDLRELRQTLDLNAKLTQIANYDALTGCSSRASFMESMEKRFHAMETEELLALIIFDFDNFKNINDTYGHEAGDMTLKTVVQKVESLLPSCSQVGRFGGDEFLILIWDMTLQQVSDLIEMVASTVYHELLDYDEYRFSISLSMGGTFRLEGDKNSADMIRRADEALYEAKRNGRNCGVIK